MSLKKLPCKIRPFPTTLHVGNCYACAFNLMMQKIAVQNPSNSRHVAVLQGIVVGEKEGRGCEWGKGSLPFTVTQSNRALAHSSLQELSPLQLGDIAIPTTRLNGYRGHGRGQPPILTISSPTQIRPKGTPGSNAHVYDMWRNCSSSQAEKGGARQSDGRCCVAVIAASRTCVADQHDVVVAAHQQVHQEVDAGGLHRGHKHGGEVGGLVGERRHPGLPVLHGAACFVHVVIEHGALQSC